MTDNRKRNEDEVSYTYSVAFLTCTNCQGTGLLAGSGSVPPECQRCLGLGQLGTDGKKWWPLVKDNAND